MKHYLIKFVSEEDHADQFIKGALFSRPAIYYHDQEKKLQPAQRDEQEAIVFANLMLYKNYDRPVFCMYMVPEEDVDTSTIRFPARLPKEFNAKYAVIVEFEAFIERLSHIKDNQYAVLAGPVKYGVPTYELSAQLLLDGKPNNLLIKPSSYRYQNEYRVIVCEKVAEDFKIYHLSESLQGVAKKVKIEDLESIDGYYTTNIVEGIESSGK